MQINNQMDLSRFKTLAGISEEKEEREEHDHCPFCGSGNIDYSLRYHNFRGQCQDCGTTGPKADTEEEAFEKWNKRFGV